MLNFKDFFIKICSENNIAGTGGVFGNFSPGEWSALGTHTDYANKDTRIPKVLGSKSKKNDKKSKKSTKFKYFKR